ncbi:MAG TPA: hypothetical protein VMF52_16585 [Steroidobacteraceae bacterium]|nr:hypothetical protein [Steroidobacteraceae bacterium]
MNAPRVPRAELIERCRRQRARLAGFTGAAVRSAHLHDIGRALRLLRRVARLLEGK